MNSGIIYLSIFSVLTGMGGYFVKLTHGISSQQILTLRAFFAVLFLLVFALITRRVHELRIKFPMSTVVMGVVEGFSIYFFYQALEKTSITNTMLLVYTTPIFGVILSRIFLKEHIQKKTIVGICFSFFGVIIVSDPMKFRISPAHMWGSIFALLGGFFYAAMAISSKQVTQKTTPLYAAFWQYLVVLIMFLPFSFPITSHQVTGNAPSLIYLGWIAGGIAFLLYMKGISLVQGQIIQVITMLEILVGSMSGIFLLGEKLTLPTIIGGAFILLGMFTVSKK